MRAGTSQVSSRSSLPKETVSSNHIRVGNAPRRPRRAATPVPMVRGTAPSSSTAATELPQGPQTPATSEDHTYKGHTGSAGLLHALFSPRVSSVPRSPPLPFIFSPVFFPLTALAVFHSRRGLPSQRGRARGRPLRRPLRGPSRLADVSRAVARCR